jgi:hypothetical protein
MTKEEFPFTRELSTRLHTLDVAQHAAWAVVPDILDATRPSTVAGSLPFIIDAFFQHMR